MDADLLRHLPLSLEEGAEDWYYRLNPLPQTWTELKDLMLNRFRLSRFLGQTENSLKSRTLRWSESISEYHDANLALFFELEVLEKTCTDQEKADQLSEGLHGEMLRDVTLMAPANPPEFLAATEKAVRISRSSERQKKKTEEDNLCGLIHSREWNGNTRSCYPESWDRKDTHDGPKGTLLEQETHRITEKFWAQEGQRNHYWNCESAREEVEEREWHHQKPHVFKRNDTDERENAGNQHDDQYGYDGYSPSTQRNPEEWDEGDDDRDFGLKNGWKEQREHDLHLGNREQAYDADNENTQMSKWLKAQEDLCPLERTYGVQQEENNQCQLEDGYGQEGNQWTDLSFGEGSRRSHAEYTETSGATRWGLCENNGTQSVMYAVPDDLRKNPDVDFLYLGD
ncbi:hypothetical protein BV898_11093 [Hypsibius exemplaris]|uniref:Retrotransposon gag domain-containing protein n=1 Tax=Hypsibius exemplaris TaxID=2072580 RepID=A0A1W0WHN9_HYPEX|nr:hypothetical protein BV898_11093 [Hypsibius exemplaris]